MNERHLFCDFATVDQAALNQFFEAMRCEFVVKGAVMPDVHLGYSLPIGSVVATKNVIVPSWVGYDIGCGMGALEIDTPPDNIIKFAPAIYERIKQTVPMGTNSHKNPVHQCALLNDTTTIVSRTQLDKRGGYTQLGTLGGGNHFIEIGYSTCGKTWIIVHSGSRGVGHGIAGAYMAVAANSDKPKEGNFPIHMNSINGRAYIADMNWCLNYAILNRATIIDFVVKAIEFVLRTQIRVGTKINRNHNHAEYRDGMWIHRKGATHAEKDMLGVIPGNMRDGSFIVKGLGNPDALWSSSHGAGRILSRKAGKELLVEDFEEDMKGIIANVGSGTIDESPRVYKDIFKVMELQKELVSIYKHIKPIINLKG